MLNSWVPTANRVRNSRVSGLSVLVGCVEPFRHWGDCQNYGPFLGPYYNTGPNTRPNLGYPKRDHNFDNPPLRLELPDRSRLNRHAALAC